MDNFPRILREERSIQVAFLLFGFLFIVWFVGAEWDGLVVFGELLIDAVKSTPTFIENAYNYFKDAPGYEFRRSLAIGAVFGGLTTAIFYLAAKGWLRIPRPGSRAISVGVLAGGLAYYFDAGFWDSMKIGGLALLAVAYLYEDEVRAFFTLDTLKNLWNREALTVLGIGLGVGAVVGGIGGQVLNYPLKHCTYQADMGYQQYRMGVVITALSALVLLVPVWTLMTRRFSRHTDDTVGYFRNKGVPYLLLFPSLLFLSVFLYYPAIRILTQSTMRLRRNRPDRQIEYCLQHYLDLSESVPYQNSFKTTLWVTVAILAITMVLALLIAILASQKIRGASIYRTLLVWPYAISPVVMGAIFLNMFRVGDNGIINWILINVADTQPAWLTDQQLAPWVIIIVAVWNGLGFNILFYVAGLQSIPADLLEAAAIDGANRVQRFFRISLPLLSPYTFFLLVANVTYSFYGIYGVIDVLTEGDPPLGPAGIEGGATNVLIYAAYEGAFSSDARVGVASAQAVILFVLVAVITLLQFRYIERRVTYGG